MEALEIIKEVAASLGEPCDDAKALKILKNLPDSLDQNIINKEWSLFRENLKVMYPYLFLSKREILRVEYNVIKDKLISKISEMGISTAHFSNITKLPPSTIYNFTMKDGIITVNDLQKIADVCDFAIDIISRVEFVNKYLMINKQEDCSDEQSEEVVNDTDANLTNGEQKDGVGL